MKKTAPKKRQAAPGTKKGSSPARMTTYDLKPVLDEIMGLLRGITVLLEKVTRPLVDVKIGKLEWMTPPVEDFFHVAVDENGEPELLVP